MKILIYIIASSVMIGQIKVIPQGKTAFTQAMAMERAGNISEAKSIYAKILEDNPKHQPSYFQTCNQILHFYEFVPLFCTLIWGTAFIAQATGMDNIGPFTFNAARFFVGFLAVAPFVFFFERKKIAQWHTSYATIISRSYGCIC